MGIESGKPRIAVNRGRETTETLIFTDHTEKKLMSISVVSVVISISVVKFVTNHLKKTLTLTPTASGGFSQAGRRGRGTR